MATTPTPRSYNQILGDMIDALRSKLGVPSLPAGDPILSILEAAAQSDLRTSQDTFQMLASIALDKATGEALERIGADEDLEKFPESPSSGLVTITDSSFTKKQTTVYQGKPAPIIGSSTVNVVSALDWPATGSIYIGRGTSQYEGPLAYTSLTNNVSYWTINLAGGNFTQKFHNLGESVILAQGGDRPITAGTVCQTPQGNTGDSVQFSTLYEATLLDGETEVSNVTVIAKKPGVVGNVAAGAITSFVSAPFVGAAITNDVPFTNGRAAEDDKDFRERIKQARQSRSKATPLAIKTSVIGATSTDENKRVVSASVVTRENFPTTLYIDDGNGYEERSEGVAYETITASALGGEQYFSLAQGRPVAKAFLLSTFSAPFNLNPGETLAVKVGGTIYEHNFNEDQIRSISNASAYEVVASINGNPNIKFNARTAENGTKVAIFADDDTNEDVEVQVPTVGTLFDANNALGFAVGKVDTLRLYKNDRLLNKDGSVASLSSKPQSQWSVMTSGETLQIVVDGVNVSGINDTYTISDIDFVNAGTIYSTVAATNSLDSWATVLNFKIPGITATVASGFINITSNAGRSSRAKLEIKGGTLTAKNMFALATSTGTDRDYTLNRNLGQIRLEDDQILIASDRLTAGSLNTRAFIESQSLSTINLTSNAELWFCVDGDAQIVKTSIQAGTTVTFSITASPTWGDRVRLTVSPAPFANVAEGDWLIFNDPASVPDQGAYRIVRKDGGNTWIEIERPAAYVASGAIVLTKGGLKIVRTTTEPQRITIPTATNYTALILVQSLNGQLRGATASVYKTTKIRVKTNSFDTSGDIALVVVNEEAQKLLLPVADAIVNLSSHLASVIAGNPQAGTPPFFKQQIATVTSNTVVDLSSAVFNPGNFLVATRPIHDTLGRWSNHNHVSSCSDLSGVTLTLRNAPLQHWLPEDVVYEGSAYAINGLSELVVLVDDDALSKRYDINMYRKGKPGSAVYGAANDFKDADNGNLSLAVGFGTAFDWKDFAVYMKARTKSHLSGGINTIKTILYRYYRFGPEGNIARLQYRYPASASSVVAVETDSLTKLDYNNVIVRLPSSPARTGTTIRTSTKMGVAVVSVTASLYDYHFVLNLAIGSAARTANVTTLTLTNPGLITDHGIQIGDTIFVNSNNVNFSSGVKTVTARTATTVDYAEVAANQAATPNIGEVSLDSVGIATLSGSTVVNNDIFSIQSGTGIGTPYAPNQMRLKTLDVNGRNWTVTSDKSAAVSTVLTWQSVNDPTKLSFFPINAGTATAALITSAVNALTGAPVSAVAVGGGTGVINTATYETVADGGEGAANPWYYLTDGLNYVKTHNTPASTAVDFNFTFKLPVTSNLTTNSDWANEDVRLVPITAKNVVDYLKSTATSGLSSVAEIIVSADGQKPQISSLTPGSAGSVQVQGGSANVLASSAKNSAVQVESSAMVVSFPSTDLDGLSGNMWVALENSTAVPKVGRFGSTTQLSTLDALGNFTLAVTNAWDYATVTLAPLAVDYQFIKQDKYVCVRALSSNFAGVKEGDVAVIKMTSGSTANDGTFRIIRQDNDVWFWIENPNCFEGIQAGTIAFLKYDSVLPGDILSINSNIWSNVGNFVVESIDLPAPFGGSGSRLKFKVQGTTTPVTGPIALGTAAPAVQLIEKNPSKLIKKVIGISPTSGDSTGSDVKFNTDEGYEKVGAFAGTIMKPIDKLAFATDIAQGIDGYQHNTGLLAEANKVIYGVESDPSTYPGVVAAGAKVNIAGPIVKRIELSLGIRLNTGINTEDVFDRVKSEVASVVNKAGVGESISISSIVEAAESVNGVQAVSIISPTYSVANDLISVQPYEKPLILNVDTDVLVSLVGE